MFTKRTECMTILRFANNQKVFHLRFRELFGTYLGFKEMLFSDKFFN